MNHHVALQLVNTAYRLVDAITLFQFLIYLHVFYPCLTLSETLLFSCMHDTVLELEFQGLKKEFAMLQVRKLFHTTLFRKISEAVAYYVELEQQTWPVRTPRPVASKLAADTPLLKGQVCVQLILSFSFHNKICSFVLSSCILRCWFFYCPPTPLNLTLIYFEMVPACA